MKNAFGKKGGGGRRSAKRVMAPLPALLITMSDRHPALLFNISKTGARLRAKDAPPEGTELFLQVGGLDVYANVVWSRGEQCGLEFQREIDSFDVEQLRREGSRGSDAGMTAAEKGGADDWVTGVAR
ncbi:MAG TPA: PilZ domain-containing protein [Sphingomicrobium sp.]|nr:PilZ domain-containing protein [Sphingomicrobium sp.]